MYRVLLSDRVLTTKSSRSDDAPDDALPVTYLFPGSNELQERLVGRRPSCGLNAQEAAVVTGKGQRGCEQAGGLGI